MKTISKLETCSQEVCVCVCLCEINDQFDWVLLIRPASITLCETLAEQ